DSPAAASGAGGAEGASETTVMIGVPTFTVTPSWASSSPTVPAKGEGSSTRDLAGSNSTSTSLTATASPGATRQETISASVSPSPTSGRWKISSLMAVPHSVGQHTVDGLEDAVGVGQVDGFELGGREGHVEARDPQHGGFEGIEGALG